MSAQVVFDCDDLKKEIFSFCLPQYPVITKDMVDDRLMESGILPDKRLQDKNYPVIAIHSLLQELKYEFDIIVPDVVECYNGKSMPGLHILPSDMECVYDKVHNKHWWGHRFDEEVTPHREYKYLWWGELLKSL